MSNSKTVISFQATQRRRDDNVLVSSAYFGGSAAAGGAAFAAGHATLSGRPAVMWTAAAGAQCFVLGSTFWFTRTVLRDNVFQSMVSTRRDEVICSGLAGSFAGMVGGAIRGPRNIVYGAAALGMLGLGGQIGFFALSTIADAPSGKRPLLDRLSDSRWWPLKSVSDEDYEYELTEKIVGVEAEIAMIDEKIAVLKQYHAKPSDGI